jgi:amino acid transporter
MALIFALSGIVLPGMSDALINVQFSTLADWFRLPVLTTRTLTMVVALLMLYIFPDGQFVPRWTRWLFAVWVVMNVLWLLIPTLPFNPSYGGTWRETLVASYMFHIAYFMSGMGAQWYRYRHTTDDQQRRQLRWGWQGYLSRR